MVWEKEFAMPPKGITTTTAQIGGDVYQRFTARCDVDGCWQVAHLLTKAAAERFLDDHKNGVKYPNGLRGWPRCPTPPMREILPSGLKYIDKLWNELDDVADALAEDAVYRDKSGERLRGYAEGLAFSVVMLENGLWANTDDVSKEVRRRRKVRNGVLPPQPTPSRFRGSMTILETGDFALAPNVPAKSTAGPAKKPEVFPTLAPDRVEKILRASGSGMFTDAEIAKTFGITVEHLQHLRG